ncbi:MAG: ankyrin repeat domain-containing protein [Chitinophagaceae bacterium]|jgi:ankyrin repeat protein|nr:ankyrin repeat domain-containing protein [Chitinophagaceae bacterium]
MHLAEDDIITFIELHAVDGIRNCFAHGLDANSLHNNQPLIYELLNEYTRSPRFNDCVKAFVDAGLQFDDSALLAVLLNDTAMLEEELKKDPSVTSKRISFRAAYTPLEQATLLHVCAEFNHVSCAELLVKYGADVNAAAGTDQIGFGGQTPIFHTVNQNNHQSKEMMHFLLEQDAKLDITVKGIIWGKGYPWETLIPSVNPISYAMMGLLPQMHRNEQIIHEVVSILLKQQYNINYRSVNVPNRYLRS